MYSYVLSLGKVTSRTITRIYFISESKLNHCNGRKYRRRLNNINITSQYCLRNLLMGS